MSCKNCEENPVETYVRIGNGNVMIVGCVKHLRELIMKLRNSKEEDEKGENDAYSTRQAKN